MTDPIVDAVCAKLQSRSAIGIKKYGTTLTDNNADIEAKLTHIQEELMDGANYIEWLLTKNTENVTCEKLSNADERQSALDATARTAEGGIKWKY